MFVLVEVLGKGLLHGRGVAGEREVVVRGGGGDEVVDLGEGVRGEDVDGGELGGERGWGGGRRRGCGCGCGGCGPGGGRGLMVGKRGEEQYE